MSLSILPHLSALVNSEKLLTQRCGGLTSKTAPELDSGRAEHRRRSSVSVPPTHVIPYHWDNWEEGFVKT